MKFIGASALEFGLVFSVCLSLEQPKEPMEAPGKAPAKPPFDLLLHCYAIDSSATAKRLFLWLFLPAPLRSLFFLFKYFISLASQFAGTKADKHRDT